VNRSEHNPLQRELARGLSGEAHPDADQLTAFAESALLKRERQQVLEHLAVCAECREVLGIAAEAAPDSTAAAKLFLLPRRALPLQRAWLPWTSIAAGLLIVCTVGLLYQQRLALRKTTVVARNESMQQPSPMPQPSPQEKKTITREAKSSANSSPQVPLSSHNMTTANALRGKQGLAAERSSFDQRNPDNLSNAEAVEGAALNPTAQKAAPALPNSAANAMLEEQRDSATQSSFGQRNPYRIANAEADKAGSQESFAKKAAATPIVTAFAGAAPAGALPTASLTAVARPHWRINSTGQAVRSFGDGAWQAVLPEEQSRMRVISVFSGEVWIGGENSRLYHSTDNGATWKLIALPGKDGRAHSIAHIHFQTLQSGTVEAEDGTVWTTSDGGSTWK